MQGPPTITSMHERALVEIAQWFARIQQYSAAHPACADLGKRAHHTLMLALEQSAPLVVTVTKDALQINDEPAGAPVLRGRFAPYLHERGVAAMRLAGGVTVEELTTLLDLLTVPVQTTFDRGGLSELVKERGVARIDVEDLAHEITMEEREAQRVRTRLRVAFGDVLQLLRARKDLAGFGDHVRALLDNPQVAVALLEENPLTVAEAVAGLCLLVREEEQKTGEELSPKLRVILMTLSAAARDRVVLGIAPLMGEFREALVWGLDLLSEEELARFALPSFRRNAGDLEIVFYALGLAAPHDGRRLATLRFLGLRFHDLPHDDPAATQMLESLAERAEELGSSHRERDVLQPHASRALLMRGAFAAPTGASSRDSARVRTPFDAGRVTYELLKMSARTRRFAALCATLPAVAARYASEGSTDAVLGIVRGLREVTRADVADVAKRTLEEVVTDAVAAQLLAELDVRSALAEGTELEDLTANVKLVAELRPEAVLERLELSESRKMRRIVLDALGAAGARIAPFVRAKLHASSWFVVRNAVSLLPACGGTPSDYLAAAHHPNEKVRAELLRALRTAPLDEGTNGVIAEMVADPAIELRARAVTMLRGELLGARGIARMAEVIRDESQPEELKRRLVVALGRSPSDAAAAALFDAMQPRGLLDLGALRDAAAEALRASPAPSAMRLFDEGLRSSVWRVRRSCEKAAERLPRRPA